MTDTLHTQTSGGSSASASEQPEKDPRRWKALIFIAVAQLMVVLDGTIVPTALPPRSMRS
ncbi:hypothetical protein ABH926_010234 [Catenulispora sp. GP43]